MSTPSRSNPVPTTPAGNPAGNSALLAWGQLVRLPNVFTVLADVSAAFLLVAGSPQPLARWLVVVAGAVALYWAGMILNDVFDLEEDRKERPKRPLAAGTIPLQQAKLAGWSCLILGVVLASISGLLPGGSFETTWLPALIATLLAVMIVAYDGPLKSTHLAPLGMGLCRFLSFLLGASPVLVSQMDQALIPKHVLGIAFGFGVYIMGITTMARHEATGGGKDILRIGALITSLGAICLALAPQLASGPMGWHIPTGRIFPVMIGMIAFPVIMRALRASRAPTPGNIQITIRSGVLTIIPLAACFALLGAGPVWGLSVFALVVPSIALSMWFRVT